MTPPPEPPLPETQEEPAKSLLIVHDDEEVQRRLTMLFNGVYTVAFVETLSLAFNLVRQGFRPQVVILPGTGGECDHPFIAGLQESLPETVLILAFKDAVLEKAELPIPASFMKLNLSRQVPEIIQTVRLGFQQHRLRLQNRKLRETLERQDVVRGKVLEEAKEMRRSARTGLRTSPEHLQLAAALGRAIGAVRPLGDHYDVNPSLFTAVVSRHAAEALGLDDPRTKRLVLAALLHDIGKLVLPPEAVSPDPATLSGESRALYESHVLEGVVLLEEMGVPCSVIDIVAQHREQPDGTGFPNHLREGEISTEARLLGLAVAYRNLVHRRPGGGLRSAEALARLRSREDKAERAFVDALASAVALVEETPGACRLFGERLAELDWSPLLADPLPGDAAAHEEPSDAPAEEALPLP